MSRSAQRARIRRIVARLDEVFGPLEPPRVADPLDELVLTVLSQHTSDLNAARAFADMRRDYPTWKQVVDAPERSFAEAIRHGGLANTKAPRIQEILREVRDREGAFDLMRLSSMTDEGARDYLMSLPGVGPKTAAVVMSFSLGHDTLPVDTHVHRVTGRLGLIPAKTSADKADRMLHDLVPDGLRTPLHVGLISLGRQVCKAQRPECGGCPVARMCPSRGRVWSG